MNVSQVAHRLRAQMRGFLGNLWAPKTARRFVFEALWGIVSRQSLHLSEIARSLGEDIALIKTENRLSRQARRPGLDETLTHHVIEAGAGRIADDTLLVIDLSDIAKPHAKAMEHLARVHDGSEGTLANGYWLGQVIGVDCGGHEITPLVNRLWSQEAPGFVSENEEILACIDAVREHTGRRGVWVMDRGGDRGKLFGALLERKARFLIRLVGDRHLVFRGRPQAAEEIARTCPLPCAETVRRQEPDGTEKILTIEFGFRRVKLPGHEEELSLLVVRGFGQKPLMVLTTLALRRTRESLWWAAEAYLTRWRIEDTLRFAKQTYEIEDVRVLRYQGLKTMMALALVAMSFTMVHLGQQTKLTVLCHHALVAAKRLFGVPDFRYYALADGLRDLLAGRQGGPWGDAEPPQDEPSDQLLLFGLAGP